MHRLRKTALALAIGETVALASSLPATAQTAVQPIASGSTSPAPGGAPTGTLGSSGPTLTSPAVGGGGYSWRNKRPVQKNAVHRPKQKVDTSRPQAKGPEFTVGPDGTSRISVQLSQKVEVAVTAYPDKYVYELPNTQVAVPNDTNPLVTTHFSTPVKSVKLIAHGKNAQLIVELREATTPQYQMRAVSGGASVLELALSKPSQPAVSSSAEARRRAQSKTSRGGKK